MNWLQKTSQNINENVPNGDLYMNCISKTSQSLASEISNSVSKVHLDIEQAQKLFDIWKQQQWGKASRPYNIPREVFKDPLSHVKRILDETISVINELKVKREEVDQETRQAWLDDHIGKVWSKWYLLNNDYQVVKK